MPDDYSADISTTALVTVGGTISGEYHTLDDVDWIGVDLVADQVYRLTQGPPEDHGVDEAAYKYIKSLYDLSGESVAVMNGRSYDLGESAVWYVIAPETGRHYVELANNAYYDSIGHYSFSVEEVSDLDDYGSSVATAGTLPLEGAVTAVLDFPGDAI